MLDEQLRAALADWVRPVAGPAPDIRVLRRRARRRGMRRAAAATVITAVAAAVVIAAAVAIGVTVTLPGAPGAGRPAAAGAEAGGGPRAWQAAPGTWQHGTWQRAGSLPAPDAGPAAAPYFVVIAKAPAAALVTDAFTGDITSIVRPPLPGQSFAGIAAAGDDRTFVLAARQAGAVGFYELRLAPAGREASLSPLFTLPVTAVPEFAVSPDASLLAYTTGTGIETVSLAAGTGRSWTAGGGAAHSLSWGGDTTVAFSWLPPGKQNRGPPPPGSGIRLLDISAPGTLLQASRLLIPPCAGADRSCVLSGALTPDGSKLLAIRFTLSRVVTTNVEEYSARTGKALTAVTPPVSSPGGSQVCAALWTDPSGTQVAAFCGHAGVYDGTGFRAAGLHVPASVLNKPGKPFAW